MAKVFCGPKHIQWEMPLPFRFEVMEKVEKEYAEKLKQWCKETSGCSDPIVGEIIRTHVADGYALYMVYRTKPLHLIHMEGGDGWRESAVWERGLNLSDVRDMVANHQEMVKMFSPK